MIIRADANAKIGSGHIMRMFALAQTWQLKAGQVIFITNCESLTLVEKLTNQNFEVVAIENSYPHQADWEITKEILDKYPGSWCAVDGYHFDNDFYSLIRENGNRLMVVDDTVRLDFYAADVILNQNINAEKLIYKCPPETKLLLGAKYAILRREFLNWQNWQRETPQIARNILITMGGSDFHNQTSKAISAIADLNDESLNIRAVVGSSNLHLTELNEKVEDLAVQIEILENAENMSELMSWADLAISAGGSTCWELCFMQLPSLLILTADNQKGIIEGLSQSGFAENLGWFENVISTDITNSLREILPAAGKRREMAEIGRKLVDGLGKIRIIEILES